MKKFYSILFVAMLLILPSLLFSSAAQSGSLKQDNGYKIDNYNVSIEVNENKVLRVTETITANFLEESRGIVRHLPLFSDVYENDGNKTIQRRYKNEYSGFSFSLENGSELVDMYSEGGFLYILMGKPDKSIRQETFTLSYTLSPGDDRDTSADNFYFNIIGNGWDTDIAHLSYEITFPKEITGKDYYIYKGLLGQDSTGVRFQANGNTISGTAENLTFGQAVTIKLNLPEGYFSFSKVIWKNILALVFIVLVLLMLIVCFVIFRRRQKPLEVVEFSAPDDLTPTQAGYLIDGTVENRDVAALIVYWASKKIIKIVEKENGETELIKLASLPEKSKKHEKAFFDKLFGESLTVNFNKLNTETAKGVTMCKALVEKDRAKFFNLKAITWQATLSIILLAVMLFATYAVGSLQFRTDFMAYRMLFAFGSVFFLIRIVDKFTRRHSINSKSYRINQIFNFIFLVGFSIGYGFFVERYCDPYYTNIILAVLPTVFAIALLFFDVYNDKGRKLLGRLKGLRRYIEIVEKDKLEMMVKDDPSAFYKILPYAYVLGVSDVYIKKFEALPDFEIILAADPLNSYFMFRNILFLNIALNGFSTKLSSIVPKAIHTNFNSSGKGGFGGFGGGGFSGGGFGGGGGGRF